MRNFLLRKQLLFLFTLLLPMFSFGQNVSDCKPYGHFSVFVIYDYDKAGNVIKRKRETRGGAFDDFDDSGMRTIGDFSLSLSSRDHRKVIFIIEPNPTHGKFVVRALDGLKGDVFCRVCDLSGRLLLQKQLQNGISDFDISTSPKGIYILQVSYNNELLTWKIIKL